MAAVVWAVAVAFASVVISGVSAGGATLASTASVAAVSSIVQLNGVSCVTATTCFAVGEGSTGRPLAPVTTLTERWNGRSWTVIPSPNPTGAKNSHLKAVSCTGAKNCLAVGRSAKTKTSGAALVERWNGTKWSIIATPNPTRTGLGGLSCVTATFCMAVGTQAGDPAGIVTHTLAERWNGAKWSIVPSPNPHVNTIVLDGVSCTSPTNCSAVGYYDVPKLETSDTLVEHWDGKTWKIIASPNAAGGASSLVGVSCPTALSCIAVGEIFEGYWTLRDIRRALGRQDVVADSLSTQRRLPFGVVHESHQLFRRGRARPKPRRTGERSGGPLERQQLVTRSHPGIEQHR